MQCVRNTTSQNKSYLNHKQRNDIGMDYYIYLRNICYDPIIHNLDQLDKENDDNRRKTS